MTTKKTRGRPAKNGFKALWSQIKDMPEIEAIRQLQKTEEKYKKTIAALRGKQANEANSDITTQFFIFLIDNLDLFIKHQENEPLKVIEANPVLKKYFELRMTDPSPLNIEMADAALRRGIESVFAKGRLNVLSNDQTSEAEKKYSAIRDAYDALLKQHRGIEPGWQKIQNMVYKKKFTRCGQILIERIVREHKKSKK